MKHRIVALALATGIALIAGSAAAQEMHYRITDTIVGSVLPQDIIRSAEPIDGRYSDLTSAQKAALASNYENMPAGDEPPYPMYGVRHMISPIVRYADVGEPVGALTASVVIDSQGKPGKIVVYKSPDEVLTRFVASQLATEEFKPAVCHGEPCEMTFVLHLDFPRRMALPVSQTPFAEMDRMTGRLNPR